MEDAMHVHVQMYNREKDVVIGFATNWIVYLPNATVVVAAIKEAKRQVQEIRPDYPEYPELHGKVLQWLTPTIMVLDH